MEIKNLRKTTPFAEIKVGQVFIDADNDAALSMRIPEVVVENEYGNKRNTVVLYNGELTYNEPDDIAIPVTAELVVR